MRTYFNSAIKLLCRINENPYRTKKNSIKHVEVLAMEHNRFKLS